MRRKRCRAFDTCVLTATETQTSSSSQKVHRSALRGIKVDELCHGHTFGTIAGVWSSKRTRLCPGYSGRSEQTRGRTHPDRVLVCEVHDVPLCPVARHEARAALLVDAHEVAMHR